MSVNLALHRARLAHVVPVSRRTEEDFAAEVALAWTAQAMTLLQVALPVAYGPELLATDVTDVRAWHVVVRRLRVQASDVVDESACILAYALALGASEVGEESQNLHKNNVILDTIKAVIRAGTYTFHGYGLHRVSAHN